MQFKVLKKFKYIVKKPMCQFFIHSLRFCKQAPRKLRLVLGSLCSTISLAFHFLVFAVCYMLYIYMYVYRNVGISFCGVCATAFVVFECFLGKTKAGKLRLLFTLRSPISFHTPYPLAFFISPSTQPPQAVSRRPFHTVEKVLWFEC